jgi:hypothetical protein
LPGKALLVIRVRTRETICRPEISQLILRAARKCGFPTPAACLAELVRDVESRAQGLFVGLDGDRPAVTAVGFLPANAFWLAPSVGFAYSEGDRTLVVAVSARLQRWLCEAGFDHAVVLNLLHTDRSYICGLRHFGKGECIGDVIRFSF